LLTLGVEHFVLVSALQNVKIRTRQPITLPVVLYGCKTWPLISREEHRLKVYENIVLRRINIDPNGMK
jgi:hypothetical protein